MIQAHIYYSGIVQGVGFRYTVEKIAVELNLRGWVKNLKDQRVEALLQGERKVIEEFCQKLEFHFKDNIKEKIFEIQPLSGKFQDFKIVS